MNNDFIIVQIVGDGGTEQWPVGTVYQISRDQVFESLLGDDIVEWRSNFATLERAGEVTVGDRRLRRLNVDEALAVLEEQVREFQAFKARGMEDI